MKTKEMLDIVVAAEAFVDGHSEPWYRSGQELLSDIRRLKEELEKQQEPRKSSLGYNLDDPFGPDGVFGPCEKADKAYADAWEGWSG